MLWRKPVLTPLGGSRVLIVGATGGLGQAVVQALCALPQTQRPAALYLCGRQREILVTQSRAVQAAGMDVSTAAFDLRDTAHARKALAQAAADGLNKVAILSGVSLSAGADGLEDISELQRGFAVNTLAPCELMLSCAALLPVGGQVVAVSSLAARLALPSSPVYCASKAALSCYARAMEPHFAARGLTLSLIEPGFFASPMSQRYQGVKLGMVSAGFAAEKIVLVLKSGKKRLSFPTSLNMGIGWVKCLPADAQSRFLQRFFSFSVLPDRERQAMLPPGGLK